MTTICLDDLATIPLFRQWGQVSGCGSSSVIGHLVVRLRVSEVFTEASIPSARASLSADRITHHTLSSLATRFLALGLER